MAFQCDETWVYGGQLLVSKEDVVPTALGVAEEKIDHSAFVQGPTQIGDADSFTEVEATLMVGPDTNEQSPQPPRSLKVNGDVEIQGNTNQNGSTVQTGVCVAPSFVGSIANTRDTPPGCKLFDIPHPTKEGYRLAHACIEGPEIGVYARGRVVNKNVIYLPQYWEKLVDPASITVSITPVGAHQNIIVKRVEPTQIHLQAQGGMPIHCFYHVFGERTDVKRLISEYEGESPADYPGDNSQYSIAGYNYDIRS